MKQEDKELLLRDLCARLPYGVKISVNNRIEILEGIDILDNIAEYSSYLSSDIEEIKPYLFPLSSITDEQEEELKNIYYSFFGMFNYTERIFDKVPFKEMKYFPYQIEEFFNKNHLDYRRLIPKGLAIDATGLNIY